MNEKTKSRQHRILVVDDEQDITLVFKRALEQAGYDVDAFNDPIAALEQVKVGKKYNLLLLDIRMPEMNGFELYRKIQRIDGKPKVCFITAFEIYYEEFRKMFPNLHVKCFLRKPIKPNDLVEQIKAEIESPMPEDVR